MIRVLSVFGTRPEAIKMAPVIRELQKYPDRVESRVCVTAQHRQMLDQVLDLFGIVPDIDLDLMRSDQSLPDLTARVLTSMSNVLSQERPDVVLVQGDTTTVMATALAAFYQQIPVGHVEAGLRTRDRYAPFPEEINRRMAAVLATYHFAPTQTAVDALLVEAVPKENIFLTGNTVIDALLWVVSQPPSLETLALLQQLGLAGEPGVEETDGHVYSRQHPCTSSPLLLVTAHRRENFGTAFEALCRGLRMVAERNPDVRIVYPVHYNPSVREPVNRILAGHPRIHLIDPLPYEPFAHLMKAAHLILTDSGGIQEEAPALGKPVLVLRDVTERPEAVESGAAKVIGTDSERIVAETERLLYDEAAYRHMARVTSPYGDGHAAERIVRVILERLGRLEITATLAKPTSVG